MKKAIGLLAFCAVFFGNTFAQKTPAGSAAFDSILNEHLSASGAGVSALVSRGGKIIYQNAAGLANVELRVPMRTDNVFRIGSITKQFTAIAILQLMEGGKLNLQDTITRFLPGYPMHGATITIEHLLTHTSGIRDFTGLTDSAQRYKLDVEPAELVRYFSQLPLRFAPGTRYEYSNSNYALLGAIIETITGGTYRQYVE
ncbi:MAG: class A beta-lactamase-related serine hydrolase, partial [Chitinophagaceae bacterium]